MNVWIVHVLAAGAIAGLAAGDGVVLRSTARVERLPVRLADLAALEGPAALALGDVVITNSGVGSDAWTLIDAGTVRRVLEDLPAGRVDWTRVTIRGSGTHVRLVAPPPLPERVAPPAGVDAEPGASEAGTVRALVAPKLAALLGVDPSDLRLEFDPRDSELLAMRVEGRTVEIRPTAMSNRMPVAITVYERERIAATGVARVGVEVRREVGVAGRELRRGDVLSPGLFRIDRQWLPPAARPAPPAVLDGATVRTRVRAGEVISAGDVETPPAIRKGDTVFVHAVSGSMVVRRLSRALGDGRVGDVVSFEPADGPASRRGRTREAYRARVSGPGQAVIVQGAEGGMP
jgi:flagella basal body P-ring formation protein FlgA